MELRLSEEQLEQLADLTAKKIRLIKTEDPSDLLTQAEVYEVMGMETPSRKTMWRHRQNGTLPKEDQTLKLNEKTTRRLWRRSTITSFMRTLEPREGETRQ